MSIRLPKLAWVAILLIVVAVPATVIARGSLNGFQYESVGRHSLYWTSDQSTNSSKYKPVPGLDNVFVISPAAITLSAEMKKGRAEFRILTGNAVAQPGPVTSSGKGFESFTFDAEVSCQPTAVEWRRVGAQKAVLAKASVHSLVPDLGCG